MKLRIIKDADTPQRRPQALVPPLAPQTHLWRYTDLGKLMLLAVKHKVFIPTLNTLRKHKDPKETLLPSYSDETLLRDSPESHIFRERLGKSVGAVRHCARGCESFHEFL